MIAGIRPEHFEDAALVGDAARRADVRRRRSTSSSRWAPSSTPTSTIEAERRPVRGARRAGRRRRRRAEVAGAGDDQVVARLDAESEVERGDEAELWLDTRKLHLFDRRPASASGPTSAGRGPGAAGGRRRPRRERASQLLAQRLDHLVVPVVRAQQQVAQADTARRPRPRCRARSEAGLAQHLDTGTYSSRNQASATSLAAEELAAAPASAGSPRPRRPRRGPRSRRRFESWIRSRTRRRQRHPLEEQPLVGLERQVARRDPLVGADLGEDLGDRARRSRRARAGGATETRWWPSTTKCRPPTR